MLSTCVVLIGVLQPFVLLVSAQGSIVGQQCITPNNQQGLCFSIDKCTPLYELLNERGREASDYVRSSLCRIENGNIILCCPTGKTNHGGNKNPRTYSYGPLVPPHCGFSNVSHNRVVGGIPAGLGAWPWIAALGYYNSNIPSKTSWGCGGSLISARHVLTAAHCAIPSDLYIVRIGDLNLVRDDDGAHPVDVYIDQRIVHPGFREFRYINDIAVLKLVEDVPFSVNLHPICLPVDENLRSNSFERKFPFLAGWGAISDSAGSVNQIRPRSDHLLEVQLPVVSNKDCDNALSRHRGAEIDNRVLCAGFAQGGKDACQGDSGGPLMLPTPQHQFNYFQIGVNSYGYGCARPGYPGVYVRVTAYLDFILEALQ